MRKYKSILYILVIAAISSCVPAKLLDESKLKLKSCESELSSIKKGAQEVKDRRSMLELLKEISRIPADEIKLHQFQPMIILRLLLGT